MHRELSALVEVLRDPGDRILEGRADELALRARNLAALRPRCSERLQAVAESLASEVELTE
jgi:hypothetical protein